MKRTRTDMKNARALVLPPCPKCKAPLKVKRIGVEAGEAQWNVEYAVTTDKYGVPIENEEGEIYDPDSRKTVTQTLEYNESEEYESWYACTKCRSVVADTDEELLKLFGIKPEE